LHQQGAVKEMAEMALALFQQLQKPGTDEDGISAEEKARQLVTEVRAIFGLKSDEAYFQSRLKADAVAPQNSPQGASASLATPQDAVAAEVVEEEEEEISPEEEARERARQLLENILTRQADICEVQRKAAREEARNGPSPYERAAEIAPIHPNARLMRRMQDCNFREVRRLTNLLLKLKRGARKGDLAPCEP
jgi:hypothetical protein